MFIAATPAKWKVFNVIWVPGSPMDCAPTAPTAVPGSILARTYFDQHRLMNVISWPFVTLVLLSTTARFSAVQATVSARSRQQEGEPTRGSAVCLQVVTFAHASCTQAIVFSVLRSWLRNLLVDKGDSLGDPVWLTLSSKSLSTEFCGGNVHDLVRKETGAVSSWGNRLEQGSVSDTAFTPLIFWSSPSHASMFAQMQQDPCRSPWQQDRVRHLHR